MKIIIFLTLLIGIISISLAEVTFYEWDGLDDTLFYDKVGDSTPDFEVYVGGIDFAGAVDKDYIDTSSFIDPNIIDFTSFSSQEHGGDTNPFVQLECDLTCFTNSADFHEGGIRMTFPRKIRAISIFTYTGNINEKLSVFNEEGMTASHILNEDGLTYQFTGAIENSIDGISSIEIDGSFWAIYYIALWDLGPQIVTLTAGPDDIFDTKTYTINEGDNLQIFVEAIDSADPEFGVPNYAWSKTDVHAATNSGTGQTVDIFGSSNSNDEGTVVVNYQITSSDGLATTEISVTVTVLNVLPILTGFIPNAINEGNNFNLLTFDITDPGSLDQHSVTYTIAGGAPIVINSEDFIIDATNYDGPSVIEICAFAADEIGAGPTACDSLTINNIAPIAIIDEPTYETDSFGVVTISGTASDVSSDPPNTATYMWDFGKGEGYVQGSQTQSVQYQVQTSSYQVTIYLNVIDKDGAQSAVPDTAIVTVLGSGGGNPSSATPSPTPNGGGSNPGGCTGVGCGAGGDPYFPPSGHSANGNPCIDTSGDSSYGIAVLGHDCETEPLDIHATDPEYATVQSNILRMDSCHFVATYSQWAVGREILNGASWPTKFQACFEFSLPSTSCYWNNPGEYGFAVVFTNDLNGFNPPTTTTPDGITGYSGVDWAGVIFKADPASGGDCNSAGSMDFKVTLGDSMGYFDGSLNSDSEFDSFNTNISADLWDNSITYHCTLIHSDNNLRIIISGKQGLDEVNYLDRSWYFKDSITFENILSNGSPIHIAYTQASAFDVGFPLRILSSSSAIMTA